MRECAEEDNASNNGVDTQVRVCETELCNNEELCHVENCECDMTTTSTAPSADNFMCYKCDVRDPGCQVPNGTSFSKTSCPTEKCLVSGSIMSVNT